MNYHKIYQQLIERAQARTLLNEYVERHHIVPRCLGGTDASANIVSLLPEEHLFAHRLLCRMHPNNTKLSFAVFMLSIHPLGKVSRKLYSNDKKRHAHNLKLAQTGVPRSQATKDACRAALKGRKPSAETLAKQQQARAKMIGVPRSFSPDVLNSISVKVSAAKTGKKRKPFSEEHIAAIRAAQQARRARETSCASSVS